MSPSPDPAVTIPLPPRRAWLWWTAWLAALLLPKAGGYPYPPTGAFSDIAVAHLPQILYLRRALLHWHTFPLWSPTYYSGYPFYANPLTELWYPPAWLGVVLPLPWGLTLVVALHWLFSAWGMYAFLRLEGHGETASFLGSIAWLGFSKTWAHWGVGHLSLVYATAWMPWLLVAAYRRGHWLRPGVVLALIFLADPRAVAYSGLLWLAWEAAQVGRAPLQQWGAAAVRWGREGLLAALLAAPSWLPLLHYTHLSTRAHLQPAEALALSLPPMGLLGLLAPLGQGEWAVYLGAGTLLLAVTAWLRGKGLFWGGSAFLFLTLALGKHLPGLPWLSGHLPFVGLLRVPPRMLFAVGFAFAVASAHGWEALHQPWPSSLRRRNLLWAGLWAIGFAITLAAAMLMPAKPALLPSAAAWAATGIVLARPAWRRNGAVWRALLALDLLAVAFVQIASLPDDFSAPFLERAAATVTAPFRWYSPSYSVRQEVAAAHGWELAEGVDPLVLQTYARFLARASGVPLHGYSVVLPPLENGDVLADRDAIPNADLLGLLNVRLVAAAYPIHASGLEPIGKASNLWLYRNTRARPRAWVEPPDGGWRAVAALAWSPNRIALRSPGPGRLVLSEIAYPGWQVQVDGRPAKAALAYGILRAVPLPPGEHTVTWRFRPWDLYLGLALAALGLLWLKLAPPSLC